MGIMKSVLMCLLVVFTVIAVLVLASVPFYVHEVSEVKKMYADARRVIDTPDGQLEYIDIGEGKPILVSHGTMGGSDNGVLLAQAFLGDQYRLIVPSRFGYLQSDLPEDASFEAQADTYAYLLDQLGLDQVVVQGMSAGGVPAVEFAIRYPEKTSACILVSSIVYAPKEEVESQKLPVSEKLYETVLKSDYLFWLLMKISPDAINSMFGATPEIMENSSDVEKTLLEDVSKLFLPVSQRFAGWRNDGKQISLLEDMPIESIQVPTLVISAKDDTIAPSSWSSYFSGRVSQSMFVEYETGGHMLVGHIEDVRKICQEFIGQD